MLICDDCGGHARYPAIEVRLRVFCEACAGKHGMDIGEGSAELGQLAVLTQENHRLRAVIREAYEHVRWGRWHPQTAALTEAERVLALAIDAFQEAHHA